MSANAYVLNETGPLWADGMLSFRGFAQSLTKRSMGAARGTWRM